MVKSASNWPGGALGIEHVAGDGTRFLAVYGHINIEVWSGTVQAGQRIGTLYDQGTNDHLHLGVRPLAPGESAASVALRGRTQCPSAPTYGYVDPIPWLGAHPPGPPRPPPPPPDPDGDGVPNDDAGSDRCPSERGVAQLAGCRGASGIEGQGELGRFLSVTSPDHWVSTGGGVPQGMVFEGSLGQLVGVPVAGTRPLYSCKVGWDQFLSTRSDCEGRDRLGLQGYIYTSPPSGLPSRPVRRCVVGGSGDHFASNDLDCEGQTKEDVLGYAIARVSLTRMYRDPDHWVSTKGGMPPGMAFESSLGQLVVVPVPGTRPVYGCRSGWDQFLSLESDCEDREKLGLQGYIYRSPPAGLPSQPVRRCLSGGDHFASNDLNCEGRTKEGVLGYAIARVSLNRMFGGPDHWVSTKGGMPPGMAFESSLGQLVAVPVPGTRPLYGCKADWDQFLSTRSDCEGRDRLGLQGYIYTSPPAGLPSQPVRRCLAGADHFASNDLDCEGTTKEDVLGFAIAGALPSTPRPPVDPGDQTGTKPADKTGTKPADKTAPRVWALSLSRRRFAAALKGAAIARRRVAVGTRVRYRLSEPAKVTFAIARRGAGRIVGGKCRKRTRANRKRKKCSPRLRGSFADRGAKGKNSFRFRGRLRGRKLKPGRYFLAARAKDGAGNLSTRTRVAFTVLSR